MEKLSLFKLGVLLLGTAFIIIMFICSQSLSKYAENGRYYLSGGDLIIDTSNGKVYTLKSQYGNEGFEKINEDALPK